MRIILILSGLILLTACGGGNRLNSGGNTAATRGATGEISRACLAADRSAATPQLCGCIQGVANREMSTSDRSRIARFFADPEFAHAIRISDTPANDDFWRRYQAFTASARAQCG